MSRKVLSIHNIPRIIGTGYIAVNDKFHVIQYSEKRDHEKKILLGKLPMSKINLVAYKREK